ncbi:GNAT family N-acetyltransferase [Culicoidibacter larvae]|nr:GNAT family N-acetyltransferase [Culicoidibacter larvae]
MEKAEVLARLYEDELLQATNIQMVQSGYAKEVFVHSNGDVIEGLLVLSDEGNKHMAGVLASTPAALAAIAEQLRQLPFRPLLLHGRYDEIAQLLPGREIKPQVFYRYEGPIQEVTDNICRAENVAADKEKMLDLYSVLFEENVHGSMSDERLIRDLALGVYFIYSGDEVAGLARYSAKSDNYAEINTVIVDNKFRGQGLGKALLKHMINQSFAERRTPFLVTGEDNVIARKMYEGLGFEQAALYAYEFYE